MKNVRFYPPMTAGELEDFFVALEDAGAHVEHAPDAPVRIQWNQALYALAGDEDQLRIQLLDAHDKIAAWSQIERVHEPWMTVHGDDVVGAEDTKTFGPYTKTQADAMLAKVRDQGMTVTGNNPWHVKTNTHGVEFDATYDGTSITIKITGANWYVSNAKVWDKLDPVMQAAKNISGDGALPATMAAADAVPTAKAPKTDMGDKEGKGISMGLVLIAVVAAVVLFGKK